MGLIKSKGNMYDFTDFQWNPIKGKCSHDCIYCYMKRWGNLKPIRIVEKEFKEFERDMEKYGERQFIFIGSSCDMFAKDIPDIWIEKIIEFCELYDNTYLFQSKNPKRFINFLFPKKTILGTTIETNRCYPEISKAPSVSDRINAMIKLRKLGYKTMITLEPIMDFDVYEMVDILRVIKPLWINLGADSGNHKLLEPSKDKLIELMNKVEIRQKKNLKRLLN